MFVRHCSTLVEVQAPAKINLFLEVLSRRDDGFHEIETLMVPIGLYDTLTLSASRDGRMDFSCRWLLGVEAELSADRRFESRPWDPLPQGEENLVVRALRRLRESAGTDQGASVHLVKRIPAAAGLGGASADAAAALVAANRAWQLGWSRQQLAALAAELGSDIPFFLHGTACVCRGRGERVEPVTGLRPLHLAVVRPPEGLSTPDVYGRCRPAAVPKRADSILAAARDGDGVQVGRLLFNRLQDAARLASSWIERVQALFERMGCLGHQMSGSGTSYFGICRHARHARRVAGWLQAAGFTAVFPVTTQTAAFRHG
jgi:4-diphosphocytidyl-2-C-methyl-D-erythritol kinase